MTEAPRDSGYSSAAMVWARRYAGLIVVIVLLLLVVLIAPTTVP